MEHLEGITILNEYMTYEAPWFVWLFAMLTLIFTAITLIISGTCNKGFPVIICLCCLATFAILAIVGAYGVWDIEKEMIYECLVDDDVTYKELTNIYEIIECRGDIYKLKFLK